MTPITIQQAFALANQHHEAGRLAEAEKMYRQILQQQPGHADALHYLGLIAHQVGQNAAAVDLIRRGLAINPNLPEAHNNLGNVLKNTGKPDEAIECYRRAIALRPDFPAAYGNLGSGLKERGEMDEAIAVYRRAIESFSRENSRGSNHAYVHSNLVYALHFHPDYDAGAIAQEYRRWNRMHAAPLKGMIQEHRNDREPQRRLRVGYVSPDFRWHAVGRNLLPLLSNHDRGKFEIICYAQVLRPDALTKLLREKSDGWRNIVGMPDEQVAKQIRDDRIDILVDLALHTGDNRLLVFAHKPAPVQVSYLGYCSSTGLETIDYRFSDPYMDPADFDVSCYSERTVRLPSTYWCYQSTRSTADEAFEKKPGEIIFGCLNTFSKASPQAQAFWARLLLAVPESRLVIHAAEGTHRDNFSKRFAAAGVDPGRIEFFPTISYDAYMQMHRRVDVALDPFPYGGGITTLDCIWQGTPVVTLSGRTAVGRGGRSILSNLGLTDLIAATPDEYVRIAADLARDSDRRAQLRKTLRTRLMDSPLRNGAGFARDVEGAYREMWRRWCERGSTDRACQPMESKGS
ncbi:MAG: tetratricopeptide repeat protein [Tepidisphaeraceae bacterium]|jgi:predicted O-linked N-acetylglucosamine transferase (SPINDLY family)